MDYNAALETIVDEDWYVFYSPGTQQVILSMSTDVAAQGAGWEGQYVTVIAPDGRTILDRDTNYSDDPVTATRPLTAYLAVGRGRYYVHILSKFQDPADLGSYQLRFTPSDRFVKQACLDSQPRLGPATRSVSIAQAAVNKDKAAIRHDKTMMREEAKTGKGPQWHAWHQTLITDQHRLAGDKRRLVAAEAILRKIQLSLASACHPL